MANKFAKSLSDNIILVPLVILVIFQIKAFYNFLSLFVTFYNFNNLKTTASCSYEQLAYLITNKSASKRIQYQIYLNIVEREQIQQTKVC